MKTARLHHRNEAATATTTATTGSGREHREPKECGALHSAKATTATATTTRPYRGWKRQIRARRHEMRGTSRTLSAIEYADQLILAVMEMMSQLRGPARRLGEPEERRKKISKKPPHHHMPQLHWVICMALLAIAPPTTTRRRLGVTEVQALQITNFRVPSFVPSNLPTMPTFASGHNHQQQAADLAKPILFDCDYDYKPDEDARLTVKWFKNKEAEPFYQWLPELNVRHFADWIRPLVNQSFVSDPHDPLKRFRSLLIRRLSMNLTGQYTCLVSSLANQDMRQSTLVVYQPPSSFTFEHRIYPAPASFVSLPPPPPPPPLPQLQQQQSRASPFNVVPETPFNPTSESAFMRPAPVGPFGAPSPTQFKGLPSSGAAGHPYQWPVSGVALQTHIMQQQQLQAPAATIVRPPNNNNSGQNQSLPQTTSSPTPAAPTVTTKIVYTHDGRPIRRKLRRKRRQLAPTDQTSLDLHHHYQQQQQAAARISSWQLKKKLGDQLADPATNQNYATQLHHFQCQASRVTPRPVLVLTVKRGADSIAQYLHESSLVSIRPYQVSQWDLFSSSSSSAAAPNYNYTLVQQQQPLAQQLQSQQPPLAAGATNPNQPPLLVTLYDVTVSATVALNVSLPASGGIQAQLLAGELAPDTTNNNYHHYSEQQQPIGINTILNFRRGQRMSFECHLELTGTEFEQRKRININEEEVYQFAEAEEQRRRLRLRQFHENQARHRQQQQQQDDVGQQEDSASSSSSSTLTLTSTMPSNWNKCWLSISGPEEKYLSLLVAVVIWHFVIFSGAVWRERMLEL